MGSQQINGEIKGRANLQRRNIKKNIPFHQKEIYFFNDALFWSVKFIFQKCVFPIDGKDQKKWTLSNVADGTLNQHHSFEKKFDNAYQNSQVFTHFSLFRKLILRK